MKAQTLNPFDLFGNQVRYVVPLFQRPYVWNREDQWEPLFEDVRAVAEQLMEAAELAAQGAGTTVPPHFLGAIVLDQQLVPTKYIQTRHVIDGQQRLTTLQLLLDATEWVVQHHGSPADAGALKSLVLNNQAVTGTPTEVFKVWPTNHDRPAFVAVMDDTAAPTGDEARAPIAKAHAYFVEAITEWAEVTGDPDKADARLSAFTRAVTQYLRLVVIDLDADDNAQVIFETLNHRGTPLLAADLIKNHVFQAAVAQGLDPEPIYESHWERLDSKQWRREVRQGRLNRPRIDVFLNYWLAMRGAHEVPADRIFSEFRALVDNLNEPLLATLSDLNAAADAYERIEAQPWVTDEGKFAYRVLDVMEQWVWGPLLLWLYSREVDELPAEQRARALRAIESWSVRRMLCRLTTKGLNKLVIDLIERLGESGALFAGDTVEAFLAAQTSDAREWPTDAAVIESIGVLEIYRLLTRKRVRMVLEALEDDHRTKKSEEPSCPRGTLTIEHVLPQGWREHWPLPGEKPPEVEGMRRDKLLHTLGNLTLVNNRLNPSLSNRPWPDEQAAARGLGEKGKRSILAEHSVLYLNKAIIAHADWDEGDILERGKKLAERVVAIWPRAEAVDA